MYRRMSQEKLLEGIGRETDLVSVVLKQLYFMIPSKVKSDPKQLAIHLGSQKNENKD